VTRTCRHPGDPLKTGSYSWHVGSDESWRRLKPKLFGTRMRRGCTGSLKDAVNHRTEQHLFRPTTSLALKFSSERVDAHYARLVSLMVLAPMAMLHEDGLLAFTLNIFFPASMVPILATDTRCKDSSHVSRARDARFSCSNVCRASSMRSILRV
jgi:hypothetical protein